MAITAVRNYSPTTTLGQQAQNLLRNDADGPSQPTAGTIPSAVDQILAKLDEIAQAADPGAVPVNELVLAVIPVTTNTFGIGGVTYEFLTAAGASVANDANIAIPLGADAAATLVNAIAAVNGTATQNALLKNVAGTAPALYKNTTVKVVADANGTSMRVRPAYSIGGAVKPSNPSITVAEAITDAGDIWTQGNVNFNTLGGRAIAENRRLGVQSKTITAAMITNKTRFEFGFTPATIAGVTIMDSAGKLRYRASLTGDTFVITGTGVLATFAGGAAPDIQATDVVTVTVTE